MNSLESLHLELLAEMHEQTSLERMANSDNPVTSQFAIAELERIESERFKG